HYTCSKYNHRQFHHQLNQQNHSSHKSPSTVRRGQIHLKYAAPTSVRVGSVLWFASAVNTVDSAWVYRPAVYGMESKVPCRNSSSAGKNVPQGRSVFGGNP